MKKIIIILIVMMIGICMTATNTSKLLPMCKDTITYDNYRIILTVPYLAKKYKRITSYEEGVFIDYTINNRALVTFFRGSMQLDDEVYCDTIYCVKKDNITSSVLYKMKGLFYRKDEYIKPDFTMSFSFANKHDFNLVTSVLDSIKIEPLKYSTHNTTQYELQH